MKNYFNTVLPKIIKNEGERSTYLNVLMRSSYINNILIGHPGIVNETSHSMASHHPSNAINVCFPFTPAINNHNAMYEILIKDIVVLGKSNLSNIKTTRSNGLSINTLRKITEQLENSPVVLEIRGQQAGMKAVDTIYKFIDLFKYKRVCNTSNAGSIGRFNHSLFIEIYPMSLCIPIFDTKKVDGFGIAIKVIDYNGRVIRTDSIIVSQHTSNLLVVDGAVVCSVTKLSGKLKSNLMLTVNNHCPRTKSAYASKHTILKTGDALFKTHSKIVSSFPIPKVKTKDVKITLSTPISSESLERSAHFMKEIYKSTKSTISAYNDGYVTIEPPETAQMATAVSSAIEPELSVNFQPPKPIKMRKVEISPDEVIHNHNPFDKEWVAKAKSLRGELRQNMSTRPESPIPARPEARSDSFDYNEVVKAPNRKKKKKNISTKNVHGSVSAITDPSMEKCEMYVDSNYISSNNNYSF